MKPGYLKKDRKESLSIVLLGVSAFLGVLILVNLASFFVASANTKGLVKDAVVQSRPDANDAEKYFAKSRGIADELKKKNLFVPPEPKKHPVKQVSAILGYEALIFLSSDEKLANGKWYKVGDMIEDARIVAIEPIQVKVEWEGKEKTFSPFEVTGSSGPGAPIRAGRDVKGPKRESAGGGPVPGRKGRRAFRNVASGERAERRGRLKNVSEQEREEFKAKMRERLNARRRAND